MKKWIIGISLALLILAAGAWLFRGRWKERKPWADNKAGFIASVQVERKQAGNNTPVDTKHFWYKNSIIYTLDIEVFQDSDDDGIGDIKGLIHRLDYIRGLGADVIWMAPFQPTPNHDDGYDITDYYTVDPRLGTMQDFEQLIAEANKRDLRVIMDLVVNHTSDQHPWFQQSFQPGAPYHNWYVWSTEAPKNMHNGMVFPGIQQSIWTFDSRAGAYYYHRFYPSQPDLNMQNPAVQQEITRIDSFWLSKGVAGFRLDAVPFIIEVPQTTGDKFEHQYELLNSMRQSIQSQRADAIMLGEANVTPEETENFFGKNGDRMQMMFNFYVNQYLFYALATGEVNTLTEALQETAGIPQQSQWAQFLRNHDEIDLGRLTEKQRNKVYEAFGPGKNMQLYDRGIRRRLAPMLGNDRRRIELAYSLLFALPSTPVIRYGDELGMGDNLALKERESVRTPMQWNDSAHAGFSKSKKPTVRPLIDTGSYSFSIINVSQQLKDSNSLLKWTEHIIRTRKSLTAIGWGAWQVLPSGSAHVLMLQYSWEGETILTMHNVSADSQEVAIKPQKSPRTLQNLLKQEAVHIAAEKRHEYNIEGYGYRWYRISN